MFAKLTSTGLVVTWPYTVGDLRKDNPNVSFPKNITKSIMQQYNMVPVLEGSQPTPGKYQQVRQESKPRREALGKDSDGVEQLGNWMIHYEVYDMFADVKGEDSDGKEVVVQTKAEAEAEYQKILDDNAASANRTTRDGLLTETDWVVTKATETSGTVSTAWKTYRQALRDISSHSNWPHLEEADWPEKP